MSLHSPQCFLADDLSGALEVGAVFHRLGHDVSISLKSTLPSKLESHRILGFDLNTRVQEPEAAYASVLHLCSALNSGEVPLVTKKIDSTLRGWVGREIQAVLDSKSAHAVALCPTNPGADRTVENGLLLIDGTPVHETAFSRDPAFPIRTSRVNQIVASQTAANLRHCLLDQVRSGEASLIEWLEDALVGGAKILSFDAVTEDDLEAIVRATRRLDANILPCGSGAMAAAVGRVLGPRQRVESSTGSRPKSPNPRTAFLVGSAHPVSRAQFETLKRERPITLHRFDPHQPSTWESTIEAVRKAPEGAVVALLPQEIGSDDARGESSLRIQRFFIAFAEGLRSAADPLNLFVTGGETARTVIDSLALETLEIVEELEPGVGVAVSGPTTISQSAPQTTIITKPGGFGTTDTLMNCYDYLNR